jgi:DNA/RNA endonuclease G (NUC1)
MFILCFKFFFFLILIFNIPDRVLATRADCLMPKVKGLDKKFNGQLDSCGEAVSGNTRCNFLCMPGYTESFTQLFCSLDSTNMASWTHRPACVEQKCTAKNNIVKIPVYAKFKLDPNEKDDINMIVLFISYDTSKKMPQYSIAHYDELNNIANFERSQLDGFVHHPCSELKNKVTSSEDYVKSGYDQGHLTPLTIMKFSWKAARSSNLLINIAPQNHYINTVNWKNIELKLESFLENKQAIVITGVCFNYYIYQFETKKKQKSINVPNCYWKLVCYRQKSETIVFGFWHNNNLDSTDNDRDEVKKLRNQDFIRSNIGGINLDMAWEESFLLLASKNNSFANSQFYQGGLNYPNYRECARTNTFPKSVEYDFAIVKQKSRKRKFLAIGRNINV